jgi:branched-chain amino acid transport system permease protein
MATMAAGAAADPHRWLAAQIRWRPAEIAFWLATVLPFFLFPSYLSLASQIAITALFALSLDLILGYAGIVSLGHAAFFGLGAYAAGIVTKSASISVGLPAFELLSFTFPGFELFSFEFPGWRDPFVGLAAAMVIAGLFGYATSFIVARYRHLTLIMITLAIGFLLHEAANKASWLTGGSDGLQGMQIGPLLGRFTFDLYGYTAYTYALVVLFVGFLMVRRLVNSPFGLSLRGIRENALRMPAIGAPSPAHIRKVYTISAVIAGIAGAVLAQTTGTVALGVIDFQRSADVLVILVLGGAGRLYGGLVGAVIFMVARDQFSGIAPQYWYFWIGLLLVLVVLFVPGGVLGLPERIRAACKRYAAGGRLAELVLRVAGIALVAASALWWLSWFGAASSEAARALPCLLYLTEPCQAAVAAAPGPVAYRPVLMWLGLACLAAELIAAALRERRAKAPSASGDGGAAP